MPPIYAARRAASNARSTVLNTGTAVRIVPANGEDEIIGIAGMWRQDPEGADEPSPGDVAADQIEAELPGAQVGSPTVTALANQTVRAWATVDTATGLVVGLHEGATTARAAARRAVANGGLVRAEHLTLIVVRS